MNTRGARAPILPQIGMRNYVYIFEDLELTFEKEQLKNIGKQWDKGMPVEQIALSNERADLEVLLALIYLADKEKIKRPFVFRRKSN